MNNYGRVYSSMGDQRKALEYYSLALPILAEVSNRAGQAAALNNSGFAWESLGDKTKGLDFHRRALKLSEAIHDQRREARAHFGIARIESGNNRLKDARREIEKSINIVESFRSKLLSPDLRADYRASVQQYFDLYIDILVMRMGKRQPRSGLIAEALRPANGARPQHG
ncbi:MAG: tetratricopeptide repeat protein [Acidobacteria bacterium]|nr:tetratricopeptide repeat protein [Acidobacteriota bacterium]